MNFNYFLQKLQANLRKKMKNKWGIIAAFYSSSVESRLEDLHAAFSDTSIKAIFTLIGEYNLNQTLIEFN